MLRLLHTVFGQVGRALGEVEQDSAGLGSIVPSSSSNTGTLPSGLTFSRNPGARVSPPLVS